MLRLRFHDEVPETGRALEGPRMQAAADEYRARARRDIPAFHAYARGPRFADSAGAGGFGGTLSVGLGYVADTRLMASAPAQNFEGEFTVKFLPVIQRPEPYLRGFRR